jgi:hypothetical protein
MQNGIAVAGSGGCIVVYNYASLKESIFSAVQVLNIPDGNTITAMTANSGEDTVLIEINSNQILKTKSTPADRNMKIQQHVCCVLSRMMSPNSRCLWIPPMLVIFKVSIFVLENQYLQLAPLTSLSEFGTTSLEAANW